MQHKRLTTPAVIGKEANTLTLRIDREREGHNGHALLVDQLQRIDEMVRSRVA